MFVLFSFILPRISFIYLANKAAGAVRIHENFARSGLMYAIPMDNRNTTGMVKMDKRWRRAVLASMVFPISLFSRDTYHHKTADINPVTAILNA
jgi:hypothetical protein